MTADQHQFGVSILGAGSFGTAIAMSLCRSGHAVRLYCRTPEQAAGIKATRINKAYFPDKSLPELIEPTSDLRSCIDQDFIFLAFPARVMDHYLEEIGAGARRGAVVVNLVKGLHPSQLTFASLFETRFPSLRYVALKGPTFARPLFMAEWSGLTCGTADPNTASLVGGLFSDGSVDIDWCSSAHAVDLLSGIKNVYAILLGMMAASGLSENTLFMLIARILHEISDVLALLELDAGVMFKYCGLGDTLMTGFCDSSRNRSLGILIGKGIVVDPGQANFLSEGVRSVRILLDHLPAARTPLLQALAAVLEGKIRPMQVLPLLNQGGNNPRGPAVLDAR